MSIRSLFLVSALTLAACTNQPTIAPDHAGIGKADLTGATADAFCGGIKGIVCADGLYCDVNLPNACSGRDLSGTCKPIDATCAAIAQPVCGCDGTTYANDCERQHNQAQLAHDGSCTTVAATGAACGGIAGILCDDGSYCDVRLPNACGGLDLSGTCKTIDASCAPVAQPVCGCDGTTYANDCERLRNQVQLAHDGGC